MSTRFRRSLLRAAAQKFAIAVLGHPFGACQMAFPSAARAGRFACGIDMQDKIGDLGPVCAFSICIEQPQVRDEVLFIIGRQGLGVGSRVGHGRIEGRLRHETSYKRRSSAGPLVGDKAPPSISDTCPPNRSNILAAVFDRMVMLRGNPLRFGSRVP